MLWIFNRAEIYLTTDLEKAGQIRSFLEENGFAYNMKVRTLNHSSGKRRSTFRKQTTEYRLYVHKKDADHALHLLTQNSRKMQ